jgi:general secretion pathway protein C
VELIRSSTWRRLTEHPQQWILGACVVILVLLIGREVWLAVRGFTYKPPQPAPVVADAGEQRGAADQIIAAGLFGQAPAQATGGGTLQQTDLQLVLRGVFTATDPGKASAMLESPDGHMQIVKVGGSLAPDTTLQQVASNHIVLMRNGAQELLYFPTPQASDAAPDADSAGADTSGPVAETSTEAPAAGGSPDELKRAAILRRLEELRARSSQ